MALSPGDPAPDFELTWQVGRPAVRRSTYQGDRPLVLFFFPLAYSPACTDGLCQVVEGFRSWNALDAPVLAISVDSPWVNHRFGQEFGAAFPVLSDFNRTVARDYGVLDPDFYGMEGVAYRSVFVIDGTGTVRYSWWSEDASVLPDLEAVAGALAGLRSGS